MNIPFYRLLIFKVHLVDIAKRPAEKTVADTDEPGRHIRHKKMVISFFRNGLVRHSVQVSP